MRKIANVLFWVGIFIFDIWVFKYLGIEHNLERIVSIIVITIVMSFIFYLGEISEFIIKKKEGGIN